jgi:hypothetical protein
LQANEAQPYQSLQSQSRHRLETDSRSAAYPFFTDDYFLKPPAIDGPMQELTEVDQAMRMVPSEISGRRLNTTGI